MKMTENSNTAISPIDGTRIAICKKGKRRIKKRKQRQERREEEGMGVCVREKDALTCCYISRASELIRADCSVSCLNKLLIDVKLA